MSIGELLALDHQSLAKHAQEGWGLANSRTADLVALAAELDRAMEENTRLRALNAEMVEGLRRLHLITTHLPDGKCRGCWISDLIAKAAQEQNTKTRKGDRDVPERNTDR